MNLYEFLDGFEPPKGSQRRAKKTKRKMGQKRRHQHLDVLVYLHPFCHYCGAPYSKDDFTLDHKIPTSRGGSSRIENVVLACNRCNNFKSDMTEQEVFELANTFGVGVQHLFGWGLKRIWRRRKTRPSKGKPK